MFLPTAPSAAASVRAAAAPQGAPASTSTRVSTAPQAASARARSGVARAAGLAQPASTREEYPRDGTRRGARQRCPSAYVNGLSPPTMGRPMTRRPAHPLIPPRTVDARQELPALELEVLERWRERDVFAESLRLREGAPQWVFYEGPPTANGPPGSHHVLSRVFKDIYPRFQTMRGYRVERKGGWDCHGLPVEIAVEQKLGITSKAQIESGIGIEEFNRQCRMSVFAFLEDWNRLTERIGFWIDLDNAYRTLDETYIESVWWAIAEIAAHGLLY